MVLSRLRSSSKTYVHSDPLPFDDLSMKAASVQAAQSAVKSDLFGYGYGGGYYGGGTVGRSNELTYDKWGAAMAYCTVPDVNRAIDLLCNAIDALPYKIIHNTTADKKNDQTIAESTDPRPRHKLLEAFREVNNDNNQSFMWESLYSLLMFGENFIEPLFGEFSLRCTGLNMLNALGMNVMVFGGRIQSFMYTYPGGGGSHMFKSWELVYDKTKNPFDQFRGLSKVAVAMTKINILRDIDRFLRDYFQNNAVPDMTVAPKGENKFGDTDMQRLRDQIRNTLKGAGNQHRVFISPAAAEYTTLDQADLDKQYTVNDPLARAVYREFGIPLSMAGDDAGTQYKAGDPVRVGFYQNTVIPAAKDIARFINFQVMPLFDTTGSERFEFDTSEFDQISEDDSLRSTVATQNYSMGIWKRDEARIYTKQEPVGGAEGEAFFEAPMPTSQLMFNNPSPTPTLPVSTDNDLQTEFARALTSKAAWDERKHPRADDGKFGEGSGNSEVESSEEKPEESNSKEKWKDRKKVDDLEEASFWGEISEDGSIGLDSDTLIKTAGGDGVSLDDFPNATASVAYHINEHGQYAKVTIQDPDKNIDIVRDIHFNEGYPAYVENDHFYLKKEQTGTGTGTKIFKSQVDAAAENGFQEIRTTGGKSQSMNGYYTWPRLGYDGEVQYTSLHTDAFPVLNDIDYDEPVEGFRTYRLTDIMRTSEGRDFWKNQGQQMDMFFDLSSGSRSRKVLDAYYAERFGSSKSVRFLKSEPPKGSIDDAGLSDEENAILDKIWDSINFDDTETSIKLPSINADTPKDVDDQTESVPGKATQSTADDELRAWERKATKNWKAAFEPVHLRGVLSDVLQYSIADSAGNADALKVAFAQAREWLADNAKWTDDRLNVVYDAYASIKSFADTRETFVERLVSIIGKAQADDSTRRGFAGAMRTELRKSGLMAFRDGMEEMDYSPESLSQKELSIFKNWLEQQSGYVTSFGAEIFRQGITETEVKSRSELWANVSLYQIWTLGKSVGKPTQHMKWKYNPEADHCPECKVLDGQVHPAEEWVAKGYIPGQAPTTCKVGCRCFLTETDDPIKGAWL